MIFIDLIQELNDTVRGAVDELFHVAWTNQSHPQDMLLVDQHGFYEQMLADDREYPYVMESARLDLENIRSINSPIGTANRTYGKRPNLRNRSIMIKR